jgi:predicted RNA methylase
MIVRTCLVAVALIVGLTWSSPAPQAEQQTPLRTPDVIFVPTPQEVVDVMLKLAKVTKNDVVYDLGSGDGRIPITAAKVYGAKDNLKTSGASDRTILQRVQFLNQDLFTTDISEATVVTLYLLPSLNLKLLPKLNKELKPGTRVVSHAFDMGPDIKPKMEPVNVNGRVVYYYTVPIN